MGPTNQKPRKSGISIYSDARILPYLLGFVWPVNFTEQSLELKICLPDHSLIKKAALHLIIKLLAKTFPEQLPSISLGWPNYLSYHNINDFVRIESPTPDKIEGDAIECICLLGFLSFDENGYIREKALDELAKFSQHDSLPFIICRTVDWVPNIRDKAWTILKNKIIPANAEVFIQLLPLIDRLTLSSRFIIDLEDKVYNLFRSEESLQLLLLALKKERSRIRSLICRMIDKIFLDIPTDILIIVAQDNDRSVRFWSVRWEERMRTANGSKALQIRKLLINDPSIKIRNLMIFASIQANDNDVKDLLFKSLFDKSIGIRDMARYYIKNYQEVDFASLYRQALAREEANLQTAIAGLGETGNKSDYDRILPFLYGSSHQVCIVLKALWKLDSFRVNSELLQVLADPRHIIRRLALRLLPKDFPEEYEEILLNLWTSAKNPEVRNSIVKSMLRLPTWIAGHALLRAVIVSPPANEAVEALEQWDPSRQKDYAPFPPSEKERVAIEQALKEAIPFLKSAIVEKIHLFLNTRYRKA